MFYFLNFNFLWTFFSRYENFLFLVRYMTEVRRLPLAPNVVEPLYQGFRELEEVLIGSSWSKSREFQRNVFFLTGVSLKIFNDLKCILDVSLSLSLSLSFTLSLVLILSVSSTTLDSIHDGWCRFPSSFSSLFDTNYVVVLW